MPKPLIQYGKDGRLLINGVDWAGYVTRFTVDRDMDGPLRCQMEFICDFGHLEDPETRAELTKSLRAMLAELEK